MIHSRKRIKSLPTKEQVETERKRYRWKKAYFKALRGTISVLTYMAAVAALIATLVLPVLQIEGTSMEPPLVNGDIVLLTKTTAFGRGDICGFAWNNKILIKRVIGIPGDWIEIDTDGTVYLNGEKLDEPYAEQIAFGECDLEFPYQVPQEQYFVLGDMAGFAARGKHTIAIAGAIAVGILILDAAITMIKKMHKKVLPRVIMICSFVAMLLINIFSWNFSSISLMLVAAVVSLTIFILQGAQHQLPVGSFLQGYATA